MDKLKDLKEILITKRDDPNPPNSNKMQNNCAEQMVKIIEAVETGKISVREYKRQMKILHFQMENGFINGKTEPMKYTGLSDLFVQARAIFD